MIDILLMIVMCRILRILQGFDVRSSLVVVLSYTSSSSPKWRTFYLLLLLELHNLCNTGGTFIPWDVLIYYNKHTHERNTQKIWNTIFVNMLTSDAEITFFWWDGLGKPRILFEHTTTTELIMTIYCICSCSPNTFCYSWRLL
jgi:hypothetical protein